MHIATSRITRQGQISVPAEVRRDLGLDAGSELVWDRQENGDYLVRPKRATLADVHEILGRSEIRLTDAELKEARRAFLGSRSKPSGSKKA